MGSPTHLITMLSLFVLQESISNHTKHVHWFTWNSSDESGGFNMSYIPDGQRDGTIMTWQKISALSRCNIFTHWPHSTLKSVSLPHHSSVPSLPSLFTTLSWRNDTKMSNVMKHSEAALTCYKARLCLSPQTVVTIRMPGICFTL